jgi:hypothetical protein
MTARLSTLWVRNLIGAVVVAIAVGVVITTILGDQWETYRNTVVPATVVAKGQSGSAGDQTWKIDSVKHLNRNPASYGPKLPEGTVLTVVTVDRSGPVKDEVCYGVITDGERRWKADNIGGFSPPAADGVTSLCSQPGLLQFSFLLPQNVIPTAMDIAAFNGSITVRLLL